jgi:hypothetical protein
VQVLELARERRGDVRRRVRGGEKNVVTARRECYGDRRRNRRLPDAAFAHHHHEPAAGTGDLVDE